MLTKFFADAQNNSRKLQVWEIQPEKVKLYRVVYIKNFFFFSWVVTSRTSDLECMGCVNLLKLYFVAEVQCISNVSLKLYCRHSLFQF